MPVRIAALFRDRQHPMMGADRCLALSVMPVRGAP